MNEAMETSSASDLILYQTEDGRTRIQCRFEGESIWLTQASGSRPHTSAPLEADCMEIFETGSTLFSTLGFPLFDPLATATEAENPAELFFCRSPGAGVDGKGLYTPEGFVVLAGSVGRLENVPSIQGTNDARVRERLIAAGVMEVSEAGTITFPRDHLFRSPSSAASALLGRTANGWREWKNAQGRTLSQVKRG